MEIKIEFPVELKPIRKKKIQTIHSNLEPLIKLLELLFSEFPQDKIHELIGESAKTFNKSIQDENLGQGIYTKLKKKLEGNISFKDGIPTSIYIKDKKIIEKLNGKKFTIREQNIDYSNLTKIAGDVELREVAEDEIKIELEQTQKEVFIIHTTNHSSADKIKSIKTWIKNKENVKILLVHPNAPEFHFPQSERINSNKRDRGEFIKCIKRYNGQKKNKQVARKLDLRLYKTKPTIKLFIFDNFIYYKTYLSDEYAEKNFYTKIARDPDPEKGSLVAVILEQFFEDIWKANSQYEVTKNLVQELNKTTVNEFITEGFPLIEKEYVLFNYDEFSESTPVQKSIIKISKDQHCTLCFIERDTKEYREIKGIIAYHIGNQISFSFREKNFYLEIVGTFPEKHSYLKVLYLHLNKDKLPRSAHGLLIDSNNIEGTQYPSRDIKNIPDDVLKQLEERRNILTIENNLMKHIPNGSDRWWESYVGDWFIFYCERYPLVSRKHPELKNLSNEEFEASQSEIALNVKAIEKESGKRKEIKIDEDESTSNSGYYYRIRDNHYLGIISRSTLTIEKKFDDLRCTFKTHEGFSMKGKIQLENIAYGNNLIINLFGETESDPDHLQIVIPIDSKRKRKTYMYGMYLLTYLKNKSIGTGRIQLIKHDKFKQKEKNEKLTNNLTSLKFIPSFLLPNRMQEYFSAFPQLYSLLPKNISTVEYTENDDAVYYKQDELFPFAGYFKVYTYGRISKKESDSDLDEAQKGIHIGSLEIKPYQYVVYNGGSAESQAVGFAYYNSNHNNLYIELKHHPIDSTPSERIGFFILKVSKSKKLSKGSILMGVLSGLSYVLEEEPLGKRLILEYIAPHKTEANKFEPFKVKIHDTPDENIINSEIKFALGGRSNNLIGFLDRQKEQFNIDDVIKENKSQLNLDNKSIYLESAIYRANRPEKDRELIKSVLVVLRQAFHHGLSSDDLDIFENEVVDQNFLEKITSNKVYRKFRKFLKKINT